MIFSDHKHCVMFWSMWLFGADMKFLLCTSLTLPFNSLIGRGTSVYLCEVLWTDNQMLVSTKVVVNGQTIDVAFW